MRKTNYCKKCFAKNPSIVSRNIAGEYILVPIRQKAKDLSSIYTMTEVGSFIWEALNGRRVVGEIKELIIKEFDVKPTKAETDLIEFLMQLEKVGAIIES